MIREEYDNGHQVARNRGGRKRFLKEVLRGQGEICWRGLVWVGVWEVLLFFFLLNYIQKVKQ